MAISNLSAAWLAATNQEQWSCGTSPKWTHGELTELNSASSQVGSFRSLARQLSQSPVRMSRSTDMTLTQSLTPSQRVARLLSEAKPRWVCQVAKRADVLLRNGFRGNRMGNQAEEALDDLDTLIAELQARCW